MSRNFKSSCKGYAVRIKRENGTFFLASGRDSLVAIFAAFSRAKMFRAELAEEFQKIGIKSRLRVVPINSTFTWSER